MFPQPPPADYYDRANDALGRLVPPTARRVLDVGCGSGALGGWLKEAVPDRVVIGVDRDPAAAAAAATRLDRAFAVDVEREAIPLPAGSVDCVLFGDLLEHLVDPEAVLRDGRRLLAAGGCVLASVPNVQHASVVTALLRGDFPYAPSGLLDATHLRFFTRASLTKLFLDAGYAPSVAAVQRVAADPAFLAAAEPLLRHLRVDPRRAAGQFTAYQYLVRGTPLGGEPPAAVGPMTFVCCAADDALLADNLLRSPDLAAGTPHRLLVVRGCPSAAAALHLGLDRSADAWVVLVHQDVYLPRGWVGRFQAELAGAAAAWPTLAVAGVYGVAGRGDAARRVGRVVDRDRLLAEPVPLPAAVDSLDELLLAVRRDAGLRLDPALGFHLYGTDLCRAAAERGRAAVVVDALAFHNSLSVGLPAAFAASARTYARRHAATLPVATSCVKIASDTDVREW